MLMHGTKMNNARNSMRVGSGKRNTEFSRGLAEKGGLDHILKLNGVNQKVNWELGSRFC